MKSISQLFTADAHETGVEIDVKHPATGEHLGKVVVRGQDSPTYRNAVAENARAMIAARTKHGADSPEYLKTAQDEKTKLVASAVKSWDFQEECTRETVVEAFEKAPWFKELVDDTTGKHKLFGTTSAGA